MSHIPNSALYKLRISLVPIILETGRSEGLNVHERICTICTKGVEDKMHVILHCSEYLDSPTTIL